MEKDTVQRSAYHSTPLINAVRARNLIQVQKLLAEGADPNETDYQDCTALMYASSGQPEIVEALIQAGANVNFRSSTNGYTPLILVDYDHTCPDKNLQCSELLRAAGAVEV